MLTDATTGHLKEAAISQTWTQLSSAWGRGDVSAVAAVFDAECDHRMLTTSGRLRRGRAEFERVFAEAFAHRAGRHGRSLRVTLASVRLISDEIAIVDGTMIFGSVAPGGQSLPSGSEPFTAVMKQTPSGWLIAACRVGTLARATS